nr:hypothetical protein [Tanacetum cinerariifolium]
MRLEECAMWDLDKITWEGWVEAMDVIPAIIPVIPEVHDEVPIVPADPLVALKVGVISVTLPTRLLDLRQTVSSSLLSRDLRGMSLLPFMMLWFQGGRTGSHLGHPHHQDHHLMTHLHQHLSFLSLSLLPHPRFVNGQRFLFDLRKLSLSGRPYRTHPNMSHRYSSLDFTSDSSSSGSSSNSLSHTSLGSRLNSLSDIPSVYSSSCDASSQTHSRPSTRVASSRVITDSSLLSAGPSCKICRSPTTSVPSSTLVSRLIAPTYAYLLPPRKRFRDSYSPEDNCKSLKINRKEERMDLGTADAEAVVDLGIGDEVRAHDVDSIGMGVEIAVSDIRESRKSLRQRLVQEV